ncbi:MULTISPECIES: dihydrofolate reductase family protein [unclassified Paraflavitalea]|uniref:dihydrofolate reductase family protein n=1 Tax=unclassified Paraflavitalea TaxID=2798305 RepID=UPI003D3293DA
MRKITVLAMMSLDGVIQSPGGKKEDVSNGFKYGGWVAPFSDATYNEVVKKELAPAAYLLGRKTFEMWSKYWPQHDEIWPGINKGMKYVFSKKLKNTDPLIKNWAHSTVVPTIASIKKLKQSKGPHLHVWGSSELIQQLLKHDLVDELRLKIHPIILGKGKKLFGSGAIPVAFKLKESITTSKGVIIASYQRNGSVKTKDIDAG